MFAPDHVTCFCSKCFQGQRSLPGRFEALAVDLHVVPKGRENDGRNERMGRGTFWSFWLIKAGPQSSAFIGNLGNNT